MLNSLTKSLLLIGLCVLNQRGLELTVVQACEKSALVGVDAIKEVYRQSNEKVVLVRSQTKDNKVQLATGFFVSELGHLLTTDSEADSYQIEIDKKLYPAKKLAGDTWNNVALLQLESSPKDLPYVALPSVGNYPQIGDVLISLSYKLALNVSPQYGYVTGLNDRYFDIEWATTLVRSTLAIDGADCGGPVFNEAGQLQGMLLHPLAETKETYFMPVCALYKIYSDLLLFGRVRYGYIGITTEVVFEKETQQLYLQVVEVQADSPAQKAGFKVSDILLKIDDTPITSRETFKNFVFFSHPGQNLSIKIRRGQQEKILSVKVVEKARA